MPSGSVLPNVTQPPASRGKTRDPPPYERALDIQRSTNAQINPHLHLQVKFLLTLNDVRGEGPKWPILAKRGSINRYGTSSRWSSRRSAGIPTSIGHPRLLHRWGMRVKLLVVSAIAHITLLFEGGVEHGTTPWLPDDASTSTWIE